MINQQISLVRSPVFKNCLVQVSSLTEADIARITERERQEQAERLVDRSTSHQDSVDVNWTAGDASPSKEQSRSLLGVSVAAGPNVTKFLYVEVAEKAGVDGPKGLGGVDGGGSMGSEFDAETAAAGLCANLYDRGEEPPSCLASLAVALASRWGATCVLWQLWAASFGTDR